MNKFLFCLLLILFPYKMYAQKHANIWALGNYQLDFNSGTPKVKFEFADYLNRGMGLISDKNGALLFYTDGFSVWNKNHELMPNGTGLLPSNRSTSTQESLVVPKPGTENEYYIFTVDPYNVVEQSGLYYSEIDLTLDGGLGDVVVKGINILGNTSNKISATFHANGRDVWLLTNKRNTNTYYSFLVTSAGVSDSPVVNQIGKSHGFWAGQLKFSPDGGKVACSRDYDFSDNTVLDLFDFDPSSGYLSNAMSFELPAERGCEGIEFSPDSKKLYVAQGGSTGESGLYQFDLILPSLESIKASRFHLDSETHNHFKQLQLAPDGNIYITKGGGGGGTGHLGVISNTNAEGADVLVEENGLYLEGGDSFVNYTPNFIQNYFFKTSFSYENTCQAKPTFFAITNDHLLDSAKWSFGEGSTSISLKPVFTYGEPGTYFVELFAHYKDQTDTISREVTINPFPLLELGEDIAVCYGSKVKADNSYTSYLWNTGDTVKTTIAHETGFYSLEVMNEHGCSSIDSLFVTVIDLPQINLPDTITISDGDSALVDPGNFQSYSWSTGESTPLIYISQKGWYSVKVSNEFGCESSKSFYLSFGNESEITSKKWLRLNPRPTSSPGKDIFFVDDNIGFVLNNTELFRTTDGGGSWKKMMDVRSGNRISFKSGYGYIIGSVGTIYKSTYKGGGWNKLETGFSDHLNGISVLDPDTILVTSDNKLFKSFDGGSSWEILNIDGVDVQDSYFTSHLVGHVACSYGTILKTVDGGNSWYATETSNTSPSDFFRITFVNDTLGFATQEHSEVYKSIDGGETWNEVNAYLDAGYALHFINEDIGFIAGEHGAIHKTIDGGTTWKWIGFDGRKWGNDLYAIHFIDENKGYATGLRGRIIRTYDGGKTWENYSITYNSISQIEVTSNKIAYALVGNELFRTSNQGLDWLNLGSPAIDQKTAKIDFLNDEIGFAIAGGSVGTSLNSGSVYKTVNGGISWTKTHDDLERLAENLYTIEFVDEELGFVSGGYYGSAVFKTTDGGASWKKVESISFGQIQFINSLTGFARSVGSPYNRIYKTVDGGETWNVAFEIDEGIQSFDFTSDSVGYFVGDASLMYKTRDGGDSWEKLDPSYGWYEDVKFYSNFDGYISDEDGRVFATRDGGYTWVQEQELIGTQNIDLVDSVIYVSGDNGNILRSIISNDQIKLGEIVISSVTDSSAHFETHIRSYSDEMELYIDLGVESNKYTRIDKIRSYSNETNENVVFTINELEPLTEYFVRIRAVNDNKTTVGRETSFLTDEIILSVDKLNPKLNIYPNPTHDIIKYEGIQNPTETYIINLAGQRLLSNTTANNFIDLSSLRPGIYLLVVVYEKTKAVRKVIKR